MLIQRTKFCRRSIEMWKFFVSVAKKGKIKNKKEIRNKIKLYDTNPHKMINFFRKFHLLILFNFNFGNPALWIERQVAPRPSPPPQSNPRESQLFILPPTGPGSNRQGCGFHLIFYVNPNQMGCGFGWISRSWAKKSIKT